MTNKDIIFSIFAIAWLIIGTLLIIASNLEVWTVNLIFISIFGVLFAFKKFNKKFASWLEKRSK